MTSIIELADAKQRLGITSSHRDAEITGLIGAAQAHIEHYCSIALSPRQVQLSIRQFDNDIKVNIYPANELVSINYTDSAGSDHSISSAVLNTFDRPAVLRPAVNTQWPADALLPAKMVISAGDWTSTKYGSVPDDIKQAMLLLVSHWFENHEAVIIGKVANELPMGVKAICRPYRLKFS